MAKIDVSGMSINDILSMSSHKIYSMSRKDIATITSRLVSAGNKRLRRMEKKGITTPATTFIQSHGGKFSVKGKDLIGVREEFLRIKGFLESETGTIKGYRKWESKVATTLRENTGINYDSLTEKQKHQFWEIYSKLEETDRANVYGAKYSESINTIYNAVKNGIKAKDIDNFVNEITARNYSDIAGDFLTKNSPFNLIDDSDELPFT